MIPATVTIRRHPDEFQPNYCQSQSDGALGVPLGLGGVQARPIKDAPAPVGVARRTAARWAGSGLMSAEATRIDLAALCAKIAETMVVRFLRIILHHIYAGQQPVTSSVRPSAVFPDASN